VTSNGLQHGKSSEGHRWLIAAFPDEYRARRAAADAETGGIDVRNIRIGNSFDALASIESEMRDELEHTGAAVTGPVPIEGVRSVVLGTIVGAIAGVVVALPFAAIDFGLGMSTRLLITGAVGLVFGAFLGAFLAGMFGPKRPSEPLAAARGCMLALPDTEITRRALLRAAPTRIDVFGAGGFLIGSLSTSDAEARGRAKNPRAWD
jgi:hypothetical protein